MSIDHVPARTPEVIAPGSGHHLHFLNHLATIKVRGSVDAAMSVVEFTAPQDLGPPLHRHETEDELFVVLDGEVVFHHGDQRTLAGGGGLAFLPHGTPHTFQVHSETARFVCVTAVHGERPRFDAMVAALGAETAVPDLPVPSSVDPRRVAEVCAEHGIEVLGPPPAPIDRSAGAPVIGR